MFDSEYTASEVAFQLRLESEGYNIHCTDVPDMAAMHTAAALVGGGCCQVGASSTIAQSTDGLSCSVYFPTDEVEVQPRWEEERMSYAEYEEEMAWLDGSEE